MKKIQQETTELNRRQFLLAAGGVGGALAVGNLSCFGLNELLSPVNPSMDSSPHSPQVPITGEYGGVIGVGAVENYEPNSITYVEVGQFFLVRLEDGKFLALSERCTHLGCSIGQEETSFACPCHGSSFALDGGVKQGPAQRPLSLYRITITNGLLEVDTSSQIRRTTVNPEDAVGA